MHFYFVFKSPAQVKMYIFPNKIFQISLQNILSLTSEKQVNGKYAPLTNQRTEDKNHTEDTL